MIKIDNTFLEWEKNFKRLFVDKVELDLLASVESITQGVQLDALDPESLISAEDELSRLSESLGERIHTYQSKSDFSYIWRKGQYASDWIPTKMELNHNLKTGKTTNVEVDAVLTEKYLEEQYYSMFNRRRADYLSNKVEIINKKLIIIAHRLKEILRQERLNQTGQFTLPENSDIMK